MIVCHCAGITDRAIAELARDGATTVQEIGCRTGAGRRFPPCRDEIRSLLAACVPPAD